MKLSDDEKESVQQNNHSEFSADEDPVEAYKRDFKRRRWEREKQAKERRLRNNHRNFKIARIIAIFILAFSVSLIIDSLWPSHIYYEKAEQGWQKRYGKGRGAALVSYIETKSFVMAVPAEIHLNYPYYDEQKEPLIIKASPFFNIPKSITVIIGEKEYHSNITDTVYYFIPFHWLLFASALFTVWRKKYSELNYALSFLPILILCIVVLRMMPN